MWQRLANLLLAEGRLDVVGEPTDDLVAIVMAADLWPDAIPSGAFSHTH